MKYLALLLTLFSSVVFSADWYVRAGATGTGTGLDWTNAFTSLPASLNRGDTYFVAAGDYPAYTFDDAASGTSAIVVKKATDAAHGTNTGWVATYATGQATFPTLSFNTSYYVFDGVTGGGNTSWNTGHGFKVARAINGTGELISLGAGVSDLAIMHTEITGINTNDENKQAGIKGVNGNSNLTFAYNSIHTIFGVHYHIGTWSNVLIEHSYMGRNRNTEAWHSEGISSIGTNTNVTIRHNLWDSVEGTAVIAGVNTGASIDWKIYGNVFAKSTTTVYYYDEPTGTNHQSMTNMQFYNNVITSIPDVSQGGIAIQNGTGNVVYNNIWFKNTANSFQINATTNSNYFSQNTRGDCTPGCDATMNSQGAANDPNAQITTVNPFVSWDGVQNPPTANFRLSQATNAGVSLAAPYNVDMTGAIRGNDGVFDRGAFEFGFVQQPLVMPPTPSAWFKFEGNLNDEYGNHGIATLLKSPSFQTVVGANGQAMYCDGNDEVTVPYLPFYDFNAAGSSKFTIMFRIRPTTNLAATPGSESIVIGRYTDAPGTNSIWQVNAFGGNANQGVYARQQNDSVAHPAFAAAANVTPVQNEWVHIAYTYDSAETATNARQKLYVDGITGMPPYSNPSRPVNTLVKPAKGTFSICGVPTYGVSNAHYTGYVDDVVIYNRVLSQAEIQAVADYAY